MYVELQIEVFVDVFEKLVSYDVGCVVVVLVVLGYVGCVIYMNNYDILEF